MGERSSGFVVPPLGGAEAVGKSVRIQRRLKPALQTVAVRSPAFRRCERGREIHAVGKQTEACATNRRGS